MEDNSRIILNRENSSNKSILVTNYVDVEATDEQFFRGIKKKYPYIKEDSFHLFEWYILVDGQSKIIPVIDCLGYYMNTSLHQPDKADVVELPEGDQMNIVLTFENFPFNLQYIKNVSKIFFDVGRQTGCKHFYWDIIVPVAN